MSADGRGREWSRRCFFGYGLGPTPLARSLARSADGRERPDGRDSGKSS